FGPDGEHIASAGSDGAIKVWHIRTGKVVQTLGNAHKGVACAVAFHPDGRHLASVGADKLVRVWDWATGRQRFERPCAAGPQAGPACGVGFSPLDLSQLAAGFDRTVTIWDWRNDRPVHALPGHEPHRISVAFSRDGRRLATGDWQGGVRLWDAV